MLKAQGEKEMADKDYAKAVDTLLAALKLDPDNATIAIEEAEAAKKAKAAELLADTAFASDIRAFFEDQRRDYPGNAEQLFLLEADALSDWEGEALKAYDRGLIAFPQSFPLLYGRAMAHEAGGALTAMEDDLRSILADDRALDEHVVLGAAGVAALAALRVPVKRALSSSLAIIISRRRAPAVVAALVSAGASAAPDNVAALVVQILVDLTAPMHPPPSVRSREERHPIRVRARHANRGRILPGRAEFIVKA